ncbi:MAG: VTT domain-containing protein [Bacteroidetes bacterium]|nr:VTT domain-containing protein [Bacteroidota bacterium]
MPIADFFATLTNPETIVKLGLPLLLLVIFAETGLFIGFFLPGDNLVFIAGLICATNPEVLNVGVFALFFLMSAAAILGNVFGYFFGKKVGEKLFQKSDSFFFKKSRIEATKVFYDKHGGKTLFIGRFLPIIRTFAPILAGMIPVDFKKFMWYNVLGAFCWIGSVGGVGYFLGIKVPQIKNYLGYIVFAIIVLTALPVLGAYFKRKR